MNISIAKGGSKSEILSAVSAAVTEEAGANTAAQSLGSAIVSYLASSLPSGDSSVTVHVSVAFGPPIAGSHPNAAPTIEEIKAAATDAAKAAVEQMLAEHKIPLGITPAA